MADARSTIEILLTGTNSVSPHLKTIQADLKSTEAATESVGKKGAASASQIGTGFQQAGGHAKSFADGVAQGLGVSVPLSIAAATTAVVAFGLNSVKNFAEFETAMRATNSLLGQTGAASQKNFESMSQDVRQLAVRLGVDAKGAAQSLYETISAGVTKPADALKILELAAKGSVGGLAEQKTVVSALTSVMGGYGKSAGEASKISDTLFQVVNLGKVNYQQLASVIGNVIPIGAAAGVAFETLGAAIATQTKSGISAGEATTNLRQIIQAYLKPTQEAAAVADLLGIKFDATRLRALGLNGALNEAVAAARGDQEAIARLFGSVEALNGVLALTGDNADTFESDLKGIEGAAGATDRAFEEMNKSAQRNWDQMAAKASEVQLKIGESLVPVLTDVVEFVDQVGVKLGLWPDDVPKTEQTQRMKDLGTAAKDTAGFVQGIINAFNELSKLNPNVPDPRLAQRGWSQDPLLDFIKGVVASEQALNKLHQEQQRLAALQNAGTITLEQYNAELKLFASGITAAAHEAAAAQDEQARSSTDSAVASSNAAAAAAEQAAAELEAANAAAEAAKRKGLATQQEQQSIRDRLAAAKEAAAEAERIVKKEAADAAQRAQAITKANEDATRTYAKYGRDVADIVADSTRRVHEINERHGEQTVAATAEAQSDQLRINQRAADDSERVEQQRAERVLQITDDLNELREGRNREALDRQLRLQREAEDREAQLLERREDRERDAARRQLDREKAAQQANEDTQEAAARATEDRAELEERATEDAEDAKRKEGADTADAQKKRDRDLRDENARHERELREAKDDDARAKENERHKDALAKIDEQRKDALDAIAERAAEDKRKREDAHKDALDRITKQLAAEKRRIAEANADRIRAIDEQARQQEESERRADAREARRLETQRTREEEDFGRRQTEAQQRLTTELANIETKAAEDKRTIEARREADITASNTALTTKINAIDKARAKEAATEALGGEPATRLDYPQPCPDGHPEEGDRRRPRQRKIGPSLRSQPTPCTAPRGGPAPLPMIAPLACRIPYRSHHVTAAAA